MTERHALYYAPDTTDPLWQRAALWLGRDAASTLPLDAPEIGGLSAARRAELAASARRYGFHATLKPPMELASGTDSTALAAAVEAFGAARRPIEIGRMQLAFIGGFLALVPVQQSDALTDFAMDCVTAFERFRAPLAAADRERRLGSELTPRQLDLLQSYGYPYVAEEFRFHMTLSDRLAETDRDAVAAAAEGWFAPVLARPYSVDRVVVFHEPASGADFMRRTDHAIGAPAAADA